MSDYKRLTKQAGWHKDIDLKDELGYSYIYQRLAELENKIEQGTLIELPFIIKCSTKYAVVVARSGRGRRLYKTVTMPIDEAEAILKAMKEKKEKSDE